jgi:hypothetical protein
MLNVLHVQCQIYLQCRKHVGADRMSILLQCRKRDIHEYWRWYDAILLYINIIHLLLYFYAQAINKAHFSERCLVEFILILYSPWSYACGVFIHLNNRAFSVIPQGPTQQRVVLHGVCSDCLPYSSGVPPGSIQYLVHFCFWYTAMTFKITYNKRNTRTLCRRF